MRAVELTVRIERKQAGLPAFVVVPASAIAHWDLAGTTTIEGKLDGVPLGRRSLKRWDDQRWFIELKGEHLESAARSVGDLAQLSIHPASTELPDELQRVLDTEPAARARWLARTEAQRRMLREDVAAAKTAATREKRARKALLPDPPAKTQPASRLDAIPPEVLREGARTGRLVARLGLTAEDGMPLCASVKPPVIAWSSVG